MKRYFLLSIVYFLLTTCSSTDRAGSVIINMDSADIFMEIADRLFSGEKITEEKWEQLFATEGYRILNWSDSGLEDVKENMIIAFSPGMQTTRDSILAITLSLEEDDFDQLMIANFTDMLRHWDEIKEFRKSYDFGHVEEKAIEKLKDFLYDPVDSFIAFPPVGIVCADLEARSKSGGIAIDLNLMYKNPDGMIDLMAHEMFHTYRRHFENHDFIYSNPVITELNNLQDEGIADMIDKGDDPTEFFEQMGYPEDFIAMYKDAQNNTSDLLAELDKITISYLDGEFTREELSGKLKDYFPFGGHPNGYFVTKMLQRHGLWEEVIENFVNPVAFIRTYNKAAREEDMHIFSDRFMEYIENLAGGY